MEQNANCLLKKARTAFSLSLLQQYIEELIPRPEKNRFPENICGEHTNATRESTLH